MADRILIPKKIWVDLREFGWGIREVSVLAGEGQQPGPDSVGSEQIIDESVEMVDLSRDVKDQMMTGDDRTTQEEIDHFNV